MNNTCMSILSADDTWLLSGTRGCCLFYCLRERKNMKKNMYKRWVIKDDTWLTFIIKRQKKPKNRWMRHKPAQLKSNFSLWFKRAPNVSACVCFLQYNIPVWLESSLTSTRAETPAGIIRALLSHPTRDAVLRLIMQQHFKEGKCWLFDERVCPWDVFGHQFQGSNSPSVPVFLSEGWCYSQINHFRGRPTRVNSASGWRH